MNWVQLVILILQLLKQFQGSQSADEFASQVEASGQLPSASGDLLKWIWENREQILEFVLKLIEMFNSQPVVTQEATDEMAVLHNLVADLKGE